MAVTNIYNIRGVEGTAAELAADTTVYASNVFLYETDTNVLKKGNGVDEYADLPAVNEV